MRALYFVCLFTLSLVADMARAEDSKTVVFLGDSLTAGFGLELEAAYPALIQEKIRQANLSYQVINAGVSGDTTAGGLRRLNWVLKRHPADVLVVALGANDGLRGVDPNATRQNLEQIIDKARELRPGVKILLVGTYLPPNLGQEYTQEAFSIFPEVGKAKDVAVLPFLLEGVGGVQELNQRDGIHPTAEGQRRLAENVWKKLLPLLKTEQPRSGS